MPKNGKTWAVVRYQKNLDNPEHYTLLGVIRWYKRAKDAAYETSVASRTLLYSFYPCFPRQAPFPGGAIKIITWRE